MCEVERGLEESQKAGDDKAQESVLIQTLIPHIASLFKKKRGGDSKNAKNRILADIA